RRDLFAGGELFVVRIDLVLHPAQILDSFALARIEPLDDGFTLRVAEFAGALLLSALDQTAVKWSCRNHGEIDGLSYQGGGQRCDVPKIRGRHGKASHAPDINRLSKCLF